MEYEGFQGANTQLPSYTYGFQGQEKQTETGWSSYKWRNSIPELGRFFNVDPLSEKYAYQSHYNFSENRVVDGRELEGLEWIPLFRTAPAPVVPNSGTTAGSSGIYEQMKSNAINNYNGIIRLLGNQATIITTLGGKGIGLANRVLHSEGDNSKSAKGKSEKSKTKSTEAGEKGVVYEVPEDATESGEPYVGRTKQGDPSKRGGKDDGRDRKKAKIIDEYDPKNPEEGAFKEQKAINERGGIDKLDNKRNEMNPERYNNAKTKYENKQHK